MSEKVKEEKTQAKTKKDNEVKKNNSKKINNTETKKNEEVTDLKVTKTKKSNNILTVKEQKELETIEKEKKAQEVLSKEKISKVYGNIFKNVVFAIVILLYFILMICGYNLMNQNIFMILLKVFSMVLIIITIAVFEIAYKKDSGKITITGIEFLVLSICTLFSIRAYIIYNNKFESLLVSFALLFAIYYIAKSIIEYLKARKKVKKEISDINKIAKKEMR